MKIFAICLAFICVTSHLLAQEWTPMNMPSSSHEFLYIIVDDLDHNKIISASEDAVFSSFDFGQSWKKVFTLQDEESAIVSIYHEPTISPDLFVLSRYSLDRIQSKNSTPTTLLNSEKPIILTSLTINPFDKTIMWIGTSHGLKTYALTNNALTDKKAFLKNEYIYTIAYHPNIPGLMFILSNHGFYTYSEETQAIQRSYSFRNNVSMEDSSVPRTSIQFFSADDSALLIMHNGNIYVSHDYGATLQKKEHDESLIASLPLDRSFDYIRASKNTLFHKSNLQTSTFRMPQSSHIYDIALHTFQDTRLFTVTDRGIYSTPLSIYPPLTEQPKPKMEPNQLLTFYAHVANEPTIQDTHKAAIAYANVSNKKTRSWHTRSRLRGLVPSLNIDFDKSKEDKIDIDRGSTSTEDTYIVGPTESNMNWGLSVKWDLANLLWNDDETTIDYREKYTIEMREDIVHEVTRLYYDRRRKQLTLHSLSKENSTEYLLCCMEIDEITAHIDGLTGGWFSESCKT